MELALYCPDYGYYETKKDNPGRRGDFFTSVSAGELFGQLLAFQFAEWLETEVGRQTSEVTDCRSRRARWNTGEGHFELAAIGAAGTVSSKSNTASSSRQPAGRNGRGKHWKNLRRASAGSLISKALTLVTRSLATSRRHFLQRTARRHAGPPLRLGRREKKWFEWGVAARRRKIRLGENPESRVRSQNSEPTLLRPRHLPSALLAVLPDGYTIEISPAAENWWREAAGVLERGRLLTIDYGLTADELFSPSRPRGTLRAYFRHHVTDDFWPTPANRTSPRTSIFPPSRPPANPPD